MLALPTTPEAVLREVIPAAADLLPEFMRSDQSDALLLAIGLQESGLADRRQGTTARPGPARGLLQFEITGVRGVMSHPSSRKHLQRVCTLLNLAFDARTIHLRLEFDDVLAFAVGRLLLYTDPNRLPQLGDVTTSFEYYERNWRPGAAATPEGRRECARRWRGNYPKALAAVVRD